MVHYGQLKDQVKLMASSGKMSGLTALLQRLGRSGVANLLAAFALLLASGQFTHAHELAPGSNATTLSFAVSHDHGHGAGFSAPFGGDPHIATAQPSEGENENLHCGVPVLTAGPATIVSPLPGTGTPPIPGGMMPPSKPACYEPPPPRA